MQIFDHSAFLLRKRSWLSIATALFALQSAAEIVSPSEALQIARQYVQVSAQSRQQIKRLSVSSKRRSQKTLSALPYYLFNDARGKGFVLVAGDDAMGEVLAYSTENTLDTTNAHPGLKFMLESYRADFVTLQQYVYVQSFTQKPVAKDNKQKAVAPLLKTQWNQTYPYNVMLGKNGKHYPYTGCVATATAQIMAFHKWPAQGQGMNEYTVPYYQDRISVDFSQSHYDWDNMLNEYSQGATETQRNAVALLMRDVGVAMNMGYTPWYSGAWGWQAKDALKEHFGYDVALINKSSEGATNFLRVVQQEIRDGFPVYLEGFPASGESAHAWVADGVDEKGLVHMNFGWGGLANAYFSLESLSLSQAGAEFGGRALSFSRNMSAYLAHPHKDGKNTLPAAFHNADIQLAGRKESSFRLPEGASKTQDKAQALNVIFQSIINKGKTFEGFVGMVIYNIQQQMVGVPQWVDQSISFQQADQINETRFEFALPTSQLPDGTYFLAPVCQTMQEKGTDTYHPIRNVPQMEIEIVGNALSVKNEFFLGAGYAWNGKPWSEKPLRVGESQTLFCPIQALQGHYRAADLLVELLDAKGHSVYRQTLPKAIVHDDFSTKNIPVVIKVPATFQPGIYRIKAQYSMHADGQWRVLTTQRDGQLPTIEVKEASTAAKELPKVQSVEKFYDIGEGKQGVDARAPQITFGTHTKCRVVLRGKKGEEFEGTLKYYFEEEATGIRIHIGEGASAEKVRVHKNGEGNSKMLPLDIAQLKVRPNQKYRLVVVHDLGNEQQRELEFGKDAVRTYEFTNARYNTKLPTVYAPQPRDFFTLSLPTKSAYVVASYPNESENCVLSTAETAKDGEANRNPKAIFYREGDYIVSYYSGQVLKWNSDEYDWNKVLSLTPSSNDGSPLQWVQQDGLLRPRGMNASDIALSIPLKAERVDALPIMLASYGYASFFTPVQGTVSDATVYRGVIDKDGKLELHELKGEIPANTAFLVNGTERGHATFHVSLAKAPVAPLAVQDNVLFGSAMATALSYLPHSYALSGDEAAFYLLETWPRPFRAFVVLSSTPASTPDHVWLHFSVVPTGLSGVSEGAATATPWKWDLSGRRITTPQRGQIMILPDGRKLMR